MTNIPDLIKRLEAAEGALDNATNEALFEIAHGRKRNISTFEQYEPSERLPDYGASIDAALTLVLEGWFWWVGHLDETDRRFTCTTSQHARVGTPSIRTVAATAPLAITIACLKARLP